MAQHGQQLSVFTELCNKRTSLHLILSHSPTGMCHCRFNWYASGKVAPICTDTPRWESWNNQRTRYHHAARACQCSVSPCPGQSFPGPPSLPDQEHLYRLTSRMVGYEGNLQVGSWSKLCQTGLLTEAVDALELAVQRGLYVDNSLFYDVLKRCIAQRDLGIGIRIHSLAVKSGYESNAFLANHIICMYASHKRVREAMQVFTKVVAPNRFMWASIILAHARHGQPSEAIQLYRKMRQSTVKPDNRIFAAVLKACGASEDLIFGREVHGDIVGAAEKPDRVVGNSLVDMYSKCGSLEDACKVFDNLPSKNVVTWTAMISGYAQHGLGLEALALYATMQQEGLALADAVTFVCLLQACASVGALLQGKQLHAEIQGRGLEVDVVVGTCLVDMYAKCGSLEDARKVFDKLPRKTVVTWTAMIAGYAKNGFAQEALALYATMQQKGTQAADAVTLICLLQACGSVAGLQKGREIHAQISKLQLEDSDLSVANAIIDMYGKCGSMDDAQQIFDVLSNRDTLTWSALIAGYARLGESELVFDLCERMTLGGKQPDGIIFVSILTVCSHVGLVDKGQKYFESMSRDYGITPTIEHYTCMVDLLGRAGHVHKAVEMVKMMPFQPDGVVWRCVLGACRKWSHVELGRQAFENALTLDERDAAAYVLMSNIYAAAKMHENAQQIRAMRIESRAWKKPGVSSWTDSVGIVHKFVVGDRDHPEWSHIEIKLKYLLVRMKKEGYVPQLDSVLRDIDEDEKEAALCGHSEKLAIAYALHKTLEGETIRVVKNLRVCDDCHLATAIISKTEKRTIICRDASRFHVYKEGRCSCGDYW